MASPLDQPVVAPTISAETGKKDVPPVVPTEQPVDDEPEVDKAYWERCLADAERAEHDFRQRGREIIKISRKEQTKDASDKFKKKLGPRQFGLG
jgi:hypothetical protein